MIIIIEFWRGPKSPSIEQLDLELKKFEARIHTETGGVYIESRRGTYLVEVLSGDQLDVDQAIWMLTCNDCRIAPKILQEI